MFITRNQESGSARWRRPLLGVAAASMILGGCAATDSGSGASSSEIAQRAAQYDAVQRQLEAQEAENARLRSSLEESRRTATPQPVAANSPAAAMGDLLPPNAKAGECYARVWVDATYRDVTKDVLVREASERVEIVPAEYGFVEEKVLVKEASSRVETTPAVWGWEEETVQTREAQKIWRVGLGDAAPANEELLSAARKGGINLDGATPGMCFHEHFVPARFETEPKQVLVSEAVDVIQATDAEYRWVEKRVLVREASFRMEEIPAKYEWAEEQVIDKPAHTIWKKGTGPIQRIDEATGEIMCLVEVPATFKTVRKRVLVSPATSRRVEIPAEYETVRVRELVTKAGEVTNTLPEQYKSVSVQKKVADQSFVWHEVHNLDHPPATRTGNKVCLTEIPAKFETVRRKVVKQPASTRVIEIPAEYEMKKVRKVVREAQEKRIPIPEKYETISLKELDKEGRMEWRSILCETNMTRDRITSIQRALADLGFNPGPIDGVVGAETMAAVNAFQRERGLPVDRYLNIDTVEALGVSPR